MTLYPIAFSRNVSSLIQTAAAVLRQFNRTICQMYTIKATVAKVIGMDLFQEMRRAQKKRGGRREGWRGDEG